MTHFEDPLARALRDVPTNAQRPLELIERRARAIRHRRRAAVASVAVVAAGAVAVPTVGPSVGESARDVRPAGPATTEPAPRCDVWSSELEGTFLTPDQVPDHLRLLWTDAVAPPPTSASMVDYRDAEEVITDRRPTGCMVSDKFRDPSDSAAVHVYAIDDDVVTRQITISWPARGQYLQPEGARVLSTDAGPLTITSKGGDTVEAVWPVTDGPEYWTAWIYGDISDEELVELTGTVALMGDQVELGTWSVAQESVVLSGEQLRPIDHETAFVADGSRIGLSASAGPVTPDTLWQSVIVGDRLVDVNGQPGVLSTGPSATLRWVTADGVLVSLYNAGRDGQESLLDIARSVQPVPADDERLTAVWQDEPAE